MNLSEYQELILKRIEENSEYVEVDVNDFLLSLISVDKEILNIALGNLGDRLHLFVNDVDLSHPHAQEFVNNIFSHYLQENLKELLELASYSKAKGLNKILPYINIKLLSKHDRSNLRKVNSPNSNGYKIRILKNKDDIKKARDNKKPHFVDLGAILKKGDDIWHSQAEDFYGFVIGNKPYGDFIAKAENMSALYREIGCDSLSKSIMETVYNFKLNYRDYYNFNRITITNACVIMAKSLSCKLSNFLEGCKEFYYIESPTGRNYNPIICPYNLISDLAPQKVEQIVDILDSCPAIGGRPIFDNFLVLVPTSGNREKQNEKPEQICEVARSFINTNKGFPILLGEKDGNCFFVCFWK